MGRRTTKKSKGSGIVNSVINSLPFEAHLPGYRFCGPGTKLHKRLARGDRGINGLDEACREHDIAYAAHKDVASRHEADKVLIEKAWKRATAADASLGERIAARLVTTLMKGKLAVGAGYRKRKRRLPTPARGGFLPFLPLLAALGAAAGGAAQIASAVNRKRNEDKTLAELTRHHRKMEATGKGLKKKKATKRRRKTGKGLRLTKNWGKGLYLFPKKP